jgi:hypothetical protein
MTFVATVLHYCVGHAIAVSVVGQYLARDSQLGGSRCRRQSQPAGIGRDASMFNPLDYHYHQPFLRPVHAFECCRRFERELAKSSGFTL